VFQCYCFGLKAAVSATVGRSGMEQTLLVIASTMAKRRMPENRPCSFLRPPRPAFAPQAQGRKCWRLEVELEA
jgi:hypothetical protein